MSEVTHERKRKRAAPKPALKNKKFKRAAAYHSSSSEDEAEPLRNDVAIQQVEKFTGESLNDEENDGVQLPNLANPGKKVKFADVVDERDSDGSIYDDDVSLNSDIEDDDGSDSEDDMDESVTSSSAPRKKAKRHDPEVFANSMQRILSSKLTNAQRSDPILSRSAQAKDASRSLNEQKLDAAARRKLKLEKKAATEKGRVTDLLGLNRDDVSTGEVVELEKQLKRTAQKGVVKLFNAVRAAQMRGIQAEKEAQDDDSKIIGMDSRKKKVDEMSKQGFLDLLASGKVD